MPFSPFCTSPTMLDCVAASSYTGTIWISVARVHQYKDPCCRRREIKDHCRSPSLSLDHDGDAELFISLLLLRSILLGPLSLLPCIVDSFPVLDYAQPFTGVIGSRWSRSGTSSLFYDSRSAGPPHFRHRRHLAQGIDCFALQGLMCRKFCVRLWVPLTVF